MQPDAATTVLDVGVESLAGEAGRAERLPT
jgi:hypothetical protein